MSLTDESDVRAELVNFARSLVKDPNSGQTTASESFNGDNNTRAFVLAKYASCINSVSVSSVANVWEADYTYAPSTKTITFGTAPGIGVNNVVINYDYVGGTTLASINNAWGKWGYTPIDLQTKSYPRFGMVWMSNTKGPSGLGFDGHRGERVLRVSIRGENADTVRDKLEEFGNDFSGKTDWYFDGQRPRLAVILGPNEPTIDDRGKLRYYGGFIDFIIQNIFEAV